jgi:UDP:flavonoid glycosyltransferase YjiC (YdhE family)
MRVLLSPLGSSGDVEPFLALAQGLIVAGHAPLLATSENFAARAATFGVPFHRLGPDWDAREAQDHFARVLAQRSPIANLALVTNKLAELQLPEVPAIAELVRACDVVVYAPLAIATLAAARKLRKPHVSVHFAPIHRAESYSPVGTNLGRIGNRLAWKVAAVSLRRATDTGLNQLVVANGLPPWRDILLDASHSRSLDLIAVSEHVLRRDPAWGPATHMTGYWFVNEPEWQPERELEAFTSTPPVVIGFGSMMGFDARAVTELILEVAAELDRPVVLQAGWAELGAASMPPNVRAIGFVPHRWLFERAACVVHHGGAGTTAAALRAGVPQAIVWHLGDQSIWGQKVAQLGVGPKPCGHRAFDARWLRRAIARMLGDESLRTRAKQLGNDIRAEDGVTQAVRVLEQTFKVLP